MPVVAAGFVKNGVVVPNAPLPEGARVEVTVVLPEHPQPQFTSALDFLESLPPARVSDLEGTNNSCGRKKTRGNADLSS